jgi:putative endonuclease
MFFVYIIQDDSNKLYKGFTNNLERRIHEHNTGGTKTTSKSKNWKLIYSETFEEKNDAIKREKYFKSAAGRRFIKIKLNL